MQKQINSLLSVEVDIEVPFFDVDSMNIVWHGHYIKYFEVARCALLKKLDYDYNQMVVSGYGWPVVDLRVKYVKPVVFMQHIIVEASLVEYENRLKIAYLVKDKKTQVKLTEGYSIQVAVDVETKTMCFASPQVLLDKLQPYLRSKEEKR